MEGSLSFLTNVSCNSTLAQVLVKAVDANRLRRWAVWKVVLPEAVFAEVMKRSFSIAPDA